MLRLKIQSSPWANFNIFSVVSAASNLLEGRKKIVFLFCHFKNSCYGPSLLFLKSPFFLPAFLFFFSQQPMLFHREGKVSLFISHRQQKAALKKTLVTDDTVLYVFQSVRREISHSPAEKNFRLKIPMKNPL